MSINYIAILVCAVLAMALGAVWYGPLFGKKWMEITGATKLDAEARKAMQKRAMPLYVVQFLLTLFQVWILSGLVSGSRYAFQNSFWIWAAFIMPIIAGSVMWNNDSSKKSWVRFLIQAGYQFVLFMIFAYVLGTWGR